MQEGWWEAMDPILGALISALVHEVATRSFGVLRERSKLNQTVIEPVHLHSGRKPTTQVHIVLSVFQGEFGQLRQAPCWLLLGIQNRSGERYEVPALYGESVDLIVDSDQYDLAALFFTQPKSFNDLPTLRALASEHAVLMSRGRQSISMVGSFPNDQEMAWIANQAPSSGLRFRLPWTSGQMNSPYQPRLSLTSDQPISSYRSTTDSLSESLTEDQKGFVEMLKRAGFSESHALAVSLRRTLRDAERLGSATRTSPQTSENPSPTPAPVYDTTCGARTRRGRRCQLLAQSARGGVCDMHIDMVAEGKSVLWHNTGQHVELVR